MQGARRASPYLPGQSDTLISNVEVTPSQTLERYQGGPLGSSSDESGDEAFERGRGHRSLVLRRVSDFPSNTPQSMTSLHVYSFCVQNLYGVEILITLYTCNLRHTTDCIALGSNNFCVYIYTYVHDDVIFLLGEERAITRTHCTQWHCDCQPWSSCCSGDHTWLCVSIPLPIASVCTPSLPPAPH